MATSYTTNLELALPTTGELAGTWGEVVNDNITSMVEEAITGLATINTWTTNAHALTTSQGTTSESRCAILHLTDTGTALTGAGTLTTPDGRNKIYIVKNDTGQSITVKTTSGTGLAIPTGTTAWVYSDGTDIIEATSSYVVNLTVASLTAVTADINGGTIDGTTIGATTPAAGSFSSISTTGDMTFGDNDKAIFGTDGDLEIYHDSGNAYSIIDDVGTGGIVVRTNGGAVNFITDEGDTMAQFQRNAESQLYYDNGLKLATKTTGVDVTGTVTADGLTVDTGYIQVNGLNPFIRMNETDQVDKNTFIRNYDGTFAIGTETDDISTRTNRIRIDHATGDISFFNTAGTISKFFWKASEESLYLANTSPVTTGVGTGTVAATSYVVGGQTSGGDSLYIRRGGATQYQLQTTNGGGSSGELHLQPYGGNVGIGTTSPKSLSGQTHLTINQEASGTQVSGIQLRVGDTDYSSLITYPTNSEGLRISTNTALPMTFQTNDTERMRIDANGQVGIGVAPAADWHPSFVDVMQIGGVGQALWAGNSSYSSNNYVWLTDNLYYDGTNQIYQRTTPASNSQYRMGAGEHNFFNIPAGTAGATITSMYNQLKLSPTVAVFNEDGQDIDFRVESDANEHILFADAGENRLAIGTSNSAYTGNSQVPLVLGAFTGPRLLFYSDLNNTGRATSGIRASTYGTTKLAGFSPSALTGIYTNSSWSTELLLAGNAIRIGSLSNDPFENLDTVQTDKIRFSDTENVFNENSQDVDFRVESDTNTHALFVQASDGHVGIGTSSPVTLLEANGSRTDTTTGISTPLGLTLRNLSATDNNYTTIQNRDADGDQNAEIKFINVSHTGNQGAMAFTTRSATGEFAEKMRIDSSGNLLLGKTSLTNELTTAGIAFKDNISSSMITSGNNNTPLLLGSVDDVALDLLGLYSLGSKAGAIGINGRPYMEASGTDTSLMVAFNGILPKGATGNTRTDAITLGSENDRFKDLYLSGGVYLGGTGAPNRLDDYEVGSWTPTYSGSTGNPTISYDPITDGRYTKIGNIVFATFIIRTDSVSGGSGNLVVSGLPFTIASAPSNYNVGTVAIAEINSFAATPPLSGRPSQGATSASLQYRATITATSESQVPVTALATGANSNTLAGTIIYYTTDS